MTCVAENGTYGVYYVDIRVDDEEYEGKKYEQYESMIFVKKIK